VLKGREIIKIKGFYAVFYRLGGVTDIRETKEIEAGDYASVGGRLPLAEFPYPSDVFDRFLDTRVEKVPRPIRRHDLVNIHKSLQEVYSLLVVSDRYDRHLWSKETKIFDTAVAGLRLMSLPNPVKIKWK